MGAKELEYLEDQRTSRLQECDNKVDPVWWSANQRKLKELERMEAWKASKGEQLSCADDIDMQDSGGEGGSDLKHPDDSPDEYLPECESDGHDNEAKNMGSSKKQRKFSVVTNESEDSLPADLRHVRNSERVIRDEIYECLPDLRGIGLTSLKAQKSTV